MNYRDAMLRTLVDAEGEKELLILHAAMGLSGEAGEIIDDLKKVRFQGHSLNTSKLVKELGDLRWYLELMCFALDITMQEVEEKNVEKLMQRYPAGFSTEASINRDKE